MRTAVSPPPLPSRQARWAQRQNEARQSRYDDRLARWRHVDAHLERALGVVRQAFDHPFGERPPGPPLDLAPDEHVIAVLPALTLVEVARRPGTPRAEYAAYRAHTAVALADRRPAPPAEPQRVLGNGSATVTDRRVVFHGHGEPTEWPFDAVIRVEHAARRPVTLLHVDGRKKISGLLCRPRDTARVRLMLELGLARHRHDVRGLLAGLTVERGLHTLERPRQPATLTAGQAPNPGVLAGRAARSLYLGRPEQRIRWRVAQGALAAAGTLVAVTLAVVHQPGTADGSGLASAGGAPSTEVAGYRAPRLPDAHRPVAVRVPDATTPTRVVTVPSRQAGATTTRATTTPRTTAVVPHKPAAPVTPASLPRTRVGKARE
jgi:hypothetical protein